MTVWHTRKHGIFPMNITRDPIHWSNPIFSNVSTALPVILGISGAVILL